MDGFDFTARIDGKHIACTVTAPADMAAPVFCFSLMSTPAVVSGGTLLRTLANYGEVQLPDLVAGKPHPFVLRYDKDDYRPVNRAWLPLGAYLRADGRTFPLPTLPAGVRATPPATAVPCDGLRLVPAPTEWVPTGATVTVATFASDAAGLAGVAGLASRCGLPPFLSPAGLPVTILTDPAQPAEGYRLTIAPDGVTIHASTSTGIHYAAVSLLVLRATHGGAIPCGTITDHPRFEWRGQHLDCARHFFQTSTIHRLIDFIALFKMNRFHWHFSDDEAFRLQVDCAPEIWQGTAFRGEGELLPGLFGGGTRAGGSYSKSDTRALVDHARSLHIEILPEIEFPAHALGLVRARPELRDPGDTGTEHSIQGYPENVVNPALPAVWDLFEQLSLEVAELFPIGILHLGCDELPDDTWAGSPLIDDLKHEKGLKSRDDVQEYAMSRLSAHLAAHGIRPAAWEEAARGQHGGLRNGALLFSWTGQGAGIEAARAGYDVVMSPAQHVYLDMAHTGDADDWGAAWAAFVSLGETVDWDVVPDPALSPRIKGVESTFWSEFTTEDTQIEPMLAPRLLGVACQAWSPARAVSVDKITALAHAHAPLFDAMGWTWRAP